MRLRVSAVVAFMLAIGSFANHSPIHAATIWKGNTNAFNVAANWTNGLPSTGPQLAQYNGLQPPDSGTLVRDIDLVSTIARNTLGMEFQAAAGVNGFRFFGGAASPGFQNRTVTGGDSIVNNDGDTQTFEIPVAMFSATGITGATAAQTWNAAAGNLVFTGTYLHATNATVNNNGGLLTITGAFDTTIGSTGKGDLIGAGGLTKNGNGTLTLGGSTSNSYTGLTTVNAGTLVLAKSGTANGLGSSTGKLVVNAGVVSFSTNQHLGPNPASAVADWITLNGGTLRTTNSAAVTLNANRGISLSAGGGTFDVTDANITFNGIIDGVGGLTKIGSGALILAGTSVLNNYTGDTTLNDGILQLNGTSRLGSVTTPGTLKLAGGTLNTSASRSASSNPIANPINLTASSAIATTSNAAGVELNLSSDSIGGSAGTLTFRNDGTGSFVPRFSGSGFNFARPIEIDNGSGTTTLNSYNTTGTTQTFSGNISGSGGYTRNASTATTGGTTIFTGDNSYTGGTLVNRGTLLVNNTVGSGTGSGNVVVSANGTLGGTGTLSGDVELDGGTLSPGASIDTLGTGGLDFNPTSTFKWEFDNSSADLVNADGNLSIDTTGAGVTLDLSGVVVTPGTKYTLISYSGAWDGGEFNGLPNGQLFGYGGNDMRIRYNDPRGGGSNGGAYNHFVTITVPVPEPATFVLAGLGLIGILLASRRRNG